ncbi:Rnase Y domain-containing protein, partial [Klebsiella pneumoniae]|uniref:Rnase Y domain-containing protein n=1 Tax=Klebsiella pneumoniae TaxID=573 RepID=UPI000E5BB338
MIALIAFIDALIGVGVGHLVAKQINDAKHEIYVEQAKAKAKAIEYEAELVLKDAKNSVLNAELEAKKRYEDKAHKNQKDFNHKLDELHKKEQKLSRYEEQMRLEEEEISKSKRIIQDLHDDGLKLKKLYQDKLDEALRVLEHSAGLTQNEAKNLLLQKVEENSRAEIAHIVRKYEEEAKSEAKRKANY